MSDDRNDQIDLLQPETIKALCKKAMEDYDEAAAELTRLRERIAELEKDTAVGWLYDNPDTGQEFSEQHPIESGEVDDAENVRVATPGELNKALLDAWRSLEEQRIDHDARGRDAYARIAPLEATVRKLREALKEIADSGRLDLADDPCWVQDVARTALIASESVVGKSEGEKDGVE